jgi:predicted MPP superfamily phosphohydrolase
MIYLLAALALLMLWMVFEARSIKPEHIKLSDEEGPVRAALLSDIHIGMLMVSHHRLSRILKAAEPDFLVIAGDLIDRPHNMDALMGLLESLDLHIPIYATLGNHDHSCLNKKPALLKLLRFNLKSKGVQLLVNESGLFVKGSRQINIVGIDDQKRGKPDPAKAKSGIDPFGDFTLAISHNPEIALALPPEYADLLVCGHFHGGQIWMPFNLEYRLFRHEKTCKDGYRKGLHEINRNRVYISRGIGNVVVPLRLGSKPEVTFIDF